MISRPSTRILLAGLLAILAPGGAGRPGGARAAPPADQPRPLIERASVELVLIEAYVEDRSGQPIRGLAAEDFVLMIDGRVQPISSLEFRDNRPAEALEAAPRPQPEQPPQTLPSQAPRRFVLFFDDATSAPAGILGARRAAEQLIATRLAVSDQVSLVSYDRSLRILQDFTTDHDALIGAIRASVDDPRRRNDFAAEVAARQEEIRALVPPGGERDNAIGQAGLLATSYALEDAVRLRRVLSALRTIVDALGPWPGYKAIVFMGDGIPENPIQIYADGFVLPQVNAQKAGDLRLEIKDLAHAAAASGVTFHAVQTSGLVAGSAAAVRTAARRSNSLESIALSTGGTTSSSNDLLKGLARAEESSRTYYLVGYTPEGPPDGRDHSVQLRVRRGGARVRWRRVFTRLAPSEARTRSIEAAHVLPGLYPELGIEIAAIQGPGAGAERVSDLVLHLPRDRVLFLPEEGHSTARLEIGLVALDDSGKETFRVARQARISVPPDPRAPAGRGLNFFCRVRLPAASQMVTAVVSDLSSGTIGAARLELPAFRQDEGDVLGLSIYSLSEKSLWIEVDPSPSASGTEPVVSEYTEGPALRSSFEVGESLACGFKMRARRATGARPLRLAIRHEDAGETTGERSVPVAVPPDRPDGALTVPMPVDGLPPGRYRLVILEGEGAASVERASLDFTLRPAKAQGGDRSGL